MAIQTFARTIIADFFYDGKTRRAEDWSRTEGIARRKLDMLHAAHKLDDLRSPPRNRLKALTGSNKGRYSVCINDQWRVVFRWTTHGPDEVDIVDYH